MSKTEKSCLHCGAPFQGSSDFCCRGCEYVHHLILEEGLDRYYELKDKNLQPVGTTAFVQRDDRELAEKWKQREEVAPGVLQQDFELKGISCVGCVWLIEKVFSRYDGAVGIEIDPQHGRVSLEASREFDLEAFAGEIQRFGYTLREWSGARGHESEGQTAGGKIGVCAFLALNAMAFTLPFYLGMSQDDALAPLLRFGVVVLASFSVLLGGSFFFRRALASLRMGMLHIDLPIALGIGVAYAGSLVGWMTRDPDLFYFDFIAIFIVLMLVGRWFQERVTERNVHQGYEAHPSEQFVERLEQTGERVGRLNVRDLQRGMGYILPTGAWVPVQSRLESSELLLSLESINGESDPRIYTKGEVIPAGAMVLSRGEEAVMHAQEDWSQSLLKRLFEIQSGGRRESSLMERILKVYILVVIALAGLGLIVWGLGIGDWRTGFQVTVSILVVSCPCAIGLAYPRINDQCARWLRTRGVYVRLHSLWGRLKRVRQLCFDKTGTLTLETLDLLNPDALRTLSDVQSQALFALVDRNLHPVGRSLKEHLLTLKPSLLRSCDSRETVEETVGFGVKTRWMGREYALRKSSDPSRAGLSDFLEQEECIASFAFRDSVRRDVDSCVQWFEQNGLSVSIISGDSAERVRQLSESLGLPTERAVGGMDPDAKARWIEERNPDSVMMVGDGANDALAFERAGCRATPVIGRGILENHSDFFFLGQGIQGVVDVFRLASLRQRTLQQVLSLTLSYNAIVVVIAMLGWMNPLLAAILMPLSSIVTVSWASLCLASRRLNRKLTQL